MNPQPIGPRTVETAWIGRLASLVHAIRNDWDEQGIRSALLKVADRPLADVARAAISATSRTDQRTPAVIALDGEHWRAPGSAPTVTTAPGIVTRCEHKLPGLSCTECYPRTVASRAVPTPEQKEAIRAAVEAGRAELARIEKLNRGRP